MKRLICWILAMLMALSLCACGNEGGEYTPTEQQTGNDVEIPQEICNRPWVSDPDQGDQRVEVHPNGKCVIGNTERTYTVVHQSETEVVLDAEGTELHFALNPLGISELHVGGNWEVHYVRFAEYWNFLYKAWFSENRGCVEIFPSGVSMPEGYFAEFRCDIANDTVEVIENGQVIYTIRNGYHEIWVTDVDGNETHYTRQIESGDTPVIPGPGMDEPLDEEERLNLAYNKALSDYNAAISGQPVYDEKGKEIADGPTLARYLYDQFLALGDYEDAGLYLHHFKSRTEVIKTEHRKTYSHLGELVYETTFDYDIPDYDIFGRLIEIDNQLFAYGIYNGFQSNDRISLTRNENDIVTHVDIKINRFVEDGDGQHPLEGSITADLEYNEKGLLVASCVTEHHSDGYSNSYITTFAYDDHGRLSRIDVPNVAYGKYFADYTVMYLYDADGKLLQQMYVLIPVDQDLEFLIRGYPFEKLVITYHYNENGLLEKTMDYCYSYSGAGDGATVYTYDDEGRLIAESRYSVGSGFEDSGYSHAEWREKTEGLGKATFYPTATGDTVTYDDWRVNVLIDISAWDWIPYRYTLNGEQFYSYSETTIMYIDLTPED